MTDAELDRLAALIARTLLANAEGTPPEASRAWLPTPVRPDLGDRPTTPPPWSGAAQPLGDIAPTRRHAPEPSPFRASEAELTKATRAAAAGKAPPTTTAVAPRPARLTRRRSATAAPIEVPIGVSNRHLHLGPDHLQALFGGTSLTVARHLTQPGQFAAAETIRVLGPKGALDAVRVVGPPRGETQLELAASDAAALGVTPPVAASGALTESAGGVTLVGPAGRVELRRGVIVAARHLHLSPDDSTRWGLRDGDRLTVRCGLGPRAVTFHDVLVRAGSGHATELHLDVDEARAAGVCTGDVASVLAWHGPPAQRRPLVTERDVVRLAREGGQVPAHAILTPSARDRARALGLLPP